LRAFSLTQRMGATLLPNLRGDVTLPKGDTTGVAEWLPTEAAQITQSDEAFTELAMTPKSVGAFTRLSRRLLLQTNNPAAEGLMLQDLAAVLSVAVDLAALDGSGANGEPLGILNTPNVGTFDGSTLDLAKLTNAQQDLADANASINDASLGYATTPTVASLLKARQRFSGSSTGVWEGSVNDGMVEGVRAMTSTQVPTATMLYADWSQLLIGSWGILEVSTNPFENFQAGIIGVRAMWTVDIALRHVESFSVATSIT